MSEKTKLGEILVRAGLIDEFQLAAALGEQARWGNRLGETLVQLGYLTEEELVRTLSRHYGIPGVHLEGKRIESDVLVLLTVEVAERFRCIPLFKKRVRGGEVLYLGMAHPEDLHIVDEVSFRTGLPVRPVLVGPIQISKAIAAFYRGEGPSPIDGEGATVLDETPISDGDTAPLFNDLSQIISEPVERPEPQTEGVEEEEAPSRAAVGDAPTTPILDPVEKPRQVPTREILHALTQLLIDKKVISREELMERIAANSKSSTD